MSTAEGMFSRKTKLAHTFSIWLGIFGVGVAASVIGNTWFDLSEIYRTDINHMTRVIISRNVGFLIGAVTGGYVFGHFHTLRWVIASLVSAGVTIILIPLCGGVLPFAHIDFVMHGFSLALYEAGSFFWLINIWSEHSGPWIQSFHCSYGTGGLVAPLIAQPYLSKTNTSITVLSVAENSQIWIPYSIFSSIFFVNALYILILHLLNNNDVKVAKTENNNVQSNQNTSPSFHLILLLSIYLMSYLALEISSNQFLSIFAVNCDLHFSKSQASFLLSLYWGSYTAGRVFGVVRAFKFRSFLLLVTDHCCIFIAVAMFYFLANTNETALWLGAGFLGWGESGIYGTAQAWFIEHGVMTSTHISYFLIGSYVGGMIPPLLLGSFIENQPFAFVYVLIGLLSVLTILLTLMGWVSRGLHDVVKFEERNQIVQNSETVNVSNS